MKLSRLFINNYKTLRNSMAEFSSQPTDKESHQFGTRYLKDESRVYEYNAWDDVDLNEEQKRLADIKLYEDSLVRVPHDRSQILEQEAASFWDKFYNKHENKFFKDRNWLFTSFPELNIISNKPFYSKDENDIKNSDDKISILEIGCGVGNTVFPLLRINKNPNLYIYCCDFSSTAISLVKENELYDESKCNAFTLDVTEKEWNVPFPQQSLNFVTLIFVVSAIDPEKMQHVINEISKYLKPDGLLLFRDYGRYDLAQLRFKKGNCIKDNFYVRGDGTRVYFFTESCLDDMFVKAGLKKVLLKTEKRLQVNRAKHMKMYRVMIVAKYSKI